MVIIKPSNIHGKGVFATKNIVFGTVIECDIIEVPRSKVLDDYIFPFIGNRVCIHVGFASFLNSSNNPNIKHIKIDKEKMISYFEVLYEIKINDELTLSYM